MAHRFTESNRYSVLCEDESEPEDLRIEMAGLPMQNFEQGPVHKVCNISQCFRYFPDHC